MQSYTALVFLLSLNIACLGSAQTKTHTPLCAGTSWTFPLLLQEVEKKLPRANLEQLKTPWSHVYLPVEKEVICSPHKTVTDILDQYGYDQTMNGQAGIYNLHADLGVMSTVVEAFNNKWIKANDYVIVSHGHFPAALAAFSRKGFIVNAHLPLGKWGSNYFRLGVAHGLYKYALRIKKPEANAKGYALGINGHRGDGGPQKNASIDFTQLLGEAKTFATKLKNSHNARLILWLEVPATHSLYDQALKKITLENLQKNTVFDKLSHTDLIAYAQKLKDLGIDVQIYTAYRRNPKVEQEKEWQVIRQDPKYQVIDDEGG